MANSSITIKNEIRLAKVRLTKCMAERAKVTEGEHVCHVLGLFQSIDGDSAYPVFVCGLEDGSVVEVSVDRVTFIDEKVAMLKAAADHFYNVTIANTENLEASELKTAENLIGTV